MLIALIFTMPAFAAVSTLSSPPPPNFYVSSSVTSVCKGLVNYIPITVTDGGVPSQINPGAPNIIGPQMVNVQLSVLNSKSSYYVRNSTAIIGSVNPNSNGTAYLAWFVPANASATTNLQLGVNYYYYTLYFDSESRNLSFSTQSCAMPLSLNVSPNILISGEIENLKIKLTNTGSVALNSLSVSVSAPTVDIAGVSTTPIQIASLGPGASVLLNDSIYASKNASTNFPLNITVDYYLNGTFGQVASDKQALSEGLINLTQSSLTLSPSTAGAGGIFSISFVLTDTGTSGASTVTVSSNPTNGFKAFGSSSTFVGTIAAGGQSPVTLSFLVNNDTKPGSYTIPVVVNYLDSFRNSLSTVIKVPVIVTGSSAALNATRAGYAARSSGGALGSVITIMLLIAVIALGYLYYKERKRRHVK
jgi:hypothetical protein